MVLYYEACLICYMSWCLIIDMGGGIHGGFCRLYTGIHALKPKPKSKTGAISESTMALNVDMKNVVSSDKVSLPPTPLTANTGLKVSAANDQHQNVIGPVMEPAIGTSAIQKKEGAVTAKVQVDKKKMDARKKSLKRL